MSVLENLKDLFTGNLYIEQMSGPIGISEYIVKTDSVPKPRPKTQDYFKTADYIPNMPMPSPVISRRVDSGDACSSTILSGRRGLRWMTLNGSIRPSPERPKKSIWSTLKMNCLLIDI